MPFLRVFWCFDHLCQNSVGSEFETLTNCWYWSSKQSSTTCSIPGTKWRNLFIIHHTTSNVNLEEDIIEGWSIIQEGIDLLKINWRSIIVTSPSTYSFFCITIVPEQFPPWCWLIIMIEGHPYWLVFHYILIWDAVFSVFKLIRLLTSNVWIWINTDFKRYYFTVDLHFFCANSPKLR